MRSPFARRKTRSRALDGRLTYGDVAVTALEDLIHALFDARAGEGGARSADGVSARQIIARAKRRRVKA